MLFTEPVERLRHQKLNLSGGYANEYARVSHELAIIYRYY